MLGRTLTFNKQEPQKRFTFDVITNEHTFYLVAETEADMNRWVQSICQIYSFSQTKESTDALRKLSSPTLLLDLVFFLTYCPGRFPLLG
ncbi:GRB2-associated-binding protein 2 [Cricetulus griseus]|uniref:GRB2-associated-binding protein 2 n=1 Tax=Cricetulus griseus TaxID=10029 RepID=G3HE42_CRIGR|nr:GRB2-associated-binding protein 2 [Cricetulus griseus]